MQYNLNDIPDLGLLGIVMHRVMNRAKSRYQEFDLNWSQASILFTLYKRSSCIKPEHDSAVDHFRDPEDGAGRLYQEESG